jgi:hypothetical protein
VTDGPPEGRLRTLELERDLLLRLLELGQKEDLRAPPSLSPSPPISAIS